MTDRPDWNTIRARLEQKRAESNRRIREQTPEPTPAEWWHLTGRLNTPAHQWPDNYTRADYLRDLAIYNAWSPTPFVSDRVRQQRIDWYRRQLRKATAELAHTRPTIQFVVDVDAGRVIRWQTRSTQ